MTRTRRTIALSDPRRTVLMDGVPTKGKGFEDQAPYTVSDLLSEAASNVKLELSDAADDRYMTVGLSLAPAQQSGLSANGKRINLCTGMSKLCGAICLNGTGHARVSKSVSRARVGRTRLWITQPDVFKAILIDEIEAYRDKARRAGKTLVVRLNVFSDVRWETEFPELFTRFPDVRFYDYTKIASRIGQTPPNYHLTFSRSERNHETALSMLAKGVNVAVVFEDHSFPTTWNGFDVIDGTVSDLRILDPRGPRGVVVALAEKDTELHGPKYAGKRNTAIRTAGFVLATSTSNVWNQDVTLA